MTKEPTREELIELLDYDLESGKLYWKGGYPSNGRSGKRALNCAGSQGYRVGRFKSRLVMAHRVLFCLAHGFYPPHIDHINGVRYDNRISNLRAASHSINNRNMETRSDNTSGVVGVSYYKRDGNWQANITLSGKTRHLGYFGTKEDAIAARKAAEEKYGFHPNHGRPKNESRNN